MASTRVENMKTGFSSNTRVGALALIAFVLQNSPLVPDAMAQGQYSISWSKIAGGGVTAPAAGGVHALRGTLGQADAGGTLVNGPYAVAGGFWPGVSLPPLPEPPLLAAERLGGGVVRIFWPLPATGFVLDQTTVLASPAAANVWSQVPFPYTTNATHISIVVPAGTERQFYRLRRP